MCRPHVLVKVVADELRGWDCFKLKTTYRQYRINRYKCKSDSYFTSNLIWHHRPNVKSTRPTLLLLFFTSFTRYLTYFTCWSSRNFDLFFRQIRKTRAPSRLIVSFDVGYESQVRCRISSLSIHYTRKTDFSGCWIAVREGKDSSVSSAPLANWLTPRCYQSPKRTNVRESLSFTGSPKVSTVVFTFWSLKEIGIIRMLMSDVLMETY